MRNLPEGAEFQLPGLTKTSSEVISVFFAKYSECKKLCVLRCLQCHIMRTDSFRPARDPNIANQLLLSYHSPITLSNHVQLRVGLSQSLVALGSTQQFLKVILQGLRRHPRPGPGACLWKR